MSDNSTTQIEIYPQKIANFAKYSSYTTNY